MDRKEERELRKAAERAFKKVIATLKQEPSVTTIEISEEKESDIPTDDIASWLFRRRQDNGDTGN